MFLAGFLTMTLKSHVETSWTPHQQPGRIGHPIHATSSGSLDKLFSDLIHEATSAKPKQRLEKVAKIEREREMSSSSEESPDDGPDIFRKGVRQRLSDPTKKVAQTKEILSKQAVQTKKILSKQVVKIAKQAEEHERFINKVTHLLGVLGFGGFCFLLGSRPQDIPYVYCLFYVTFVPLRWIYYRYKKWHYYLLDFCYYANTIFIVMLLFYPRNEKLFLVCFSFAEGPLAWALIIWRCSLVFSSVDKIVSVLIHLLPGIVFFTIRWWDPATSADMHPEGKASGRAPWPYVEDKSYLWMWLFAVPLAVYTLWQLLYFLIVNVLRRQRLLRDPEVMTSYRELSKKAQKANSIWWRLSGLLGDQNRMVMYILLQAAFTVATMALTVPIFFSYKMHFIFQILKVSASIWNGGSFLLEVMPRQVVQKEKRKLEMKPIPVRPDQSTEDAPLTNSCNTMEVEFEMKSLPVQPDKSTVDSLTNNCDSAKVN